MIKETLANLVPYGKIDLDEKIVGSKRSNQEDKG